MIKNLKRVFLASFSILGISTLVWIILLANPSFTYAHSSQVGQVCVFSQRHLPDLLEDEISAAIEIVKVSELYREDLAIQLCLNDGSFFPKLHPFAGGLAYSFFNKSVIYNSLILPNLGLAVDSDETKRAYLLRWLLAHEFMHVMQSNRNHWHQFDIGSWKLEGHAEYISRGWKGDKLLKTKIDLYLRESQKEKGEIATIVLEDGTHQNQYYYKLGLITQYLFENEGLDFDQFMYDERSLEVLFHDMLNSIME